jgi:hypothetical protein
MPGVYYIERRKRVLGKRMGPAPANERNKMRIKRIAAIALTLALPAWGAVAQDGPPPGQDAPPGIDNNGPPDGPPPGGPQDGQGPRRGHRPPLPLVIAALDANHDGVISADEIANAPAVLRTLDKNGDGQLTLEELMGPPPPRPRPPQGDGSNQPGGPQQNGRPHGPPGAPPGQQADQPPGPPDGGPGNGPDRPRRPLPPIFLALDTNGDGVISADEIANAAASLLKLDKNGDGQLTMDELMPPRPKPPVPEGKN